MKRLFILAVLLFVVGCGATDLPPYIVKVVGPYNRNVCTGAAYNPYTVITAYHCVSKGTSDRIITTNNLHYSFRVAYEDPERDIAVLRTNLPMPAVQYARFGPAKEGVQGYMYGLCPLHFPYALPVTYKGVHKGKIYHNGGVKERLYEQWFGLDKREACGGDSGGFVLQEGKIVGVTSAVYSEYMFLVLGQEIYTVPYYLFVESLYATDNN